MDFSLIDSLKLVSALGLAFYLRSLIASFGYLGMSELRRRAESGNDEATQVLQARVHGLKLWGMLWFLFALMVVAIVTALDALLWDWLATLTSIAILMVLLFILPRIRWFKPGLHLASSVAPPLAGFLARLQFLARLFRPLRLSEKIVLDLSPGIYSKGHLLEILRDLKIKSKSAKVGADLDLAIASLTFNAKQIKTFMTPVAEMHTLKAKKPLTPKFIDELYNTGLAIFPVTRSGENDFCGLLYLQDVDKVDPAGRLVHEVMRPQIHYVYVDSSLRHVLNAFLKTGQRVFMVVDQSRNVEGIISFEETLKQLIGPHQVEDFQYYDDIDLVVDQFSQTASLPPKQPKRRIPSYPRITPDRRPAAKSAASGLRQIKRKTQKTVRKINKTTRKKKSTASKP